MAHELVVQTRDSTGVNAVHHIALSQCINVNFYCMLTRDSIKKGEGKELATA